MERETSGQGCCAKLISVLCSLTSDSHHQRSRYRRAAASRPSPLAHAPIAAPHHKPFMMHLARTQEEKIGLDSRIISRLRYWLATRMTEAQRHVRAYLAEIGRRGGEASRRDLTRQHAKKMVDIRKAKRAALKAGKPWPPRDRRLLKLT